jgi:ribosome-binding factor A
MWKTMETLISFVKLRRIIEVKADKKRKASVYITCLMETENSQTIQNTKNINKRRRRLVWYQPMGNE